MEPRWIWQQRDSPCFRWDAAALQPVLLQASAARLGLAEQLDRLDAGLGREALAALISRQSLSTAAIEGEQLDPAEVRSSVARSFQLPPDMPGSPQRQASAKEEGLVQLLLASTAELDEPLTLAALHRWHADLFAAGPDGLRAIAIGDLRGFLPMQVVSGAIGRETLHVEAPPREGLERQLTLLTDWFNGPSLALDGLIRAGLARPHGSRPGPDLQAGGSSEANRSADGRRRGALGPDPAAAAGLLPGAGALPAGRIGGDVLAAVVSGAGGSRGPRQPGAVLVAAPPQRPQCTPAEAAQPLARCRTRRLRRGDDAAQSDWPHQGEPGHSLAYRLFMPGRGA